MRKLKSLSLFILLIVFFIWIPNICKAEETDIHIGDLFYKILDENAKTVEVCGIYESEFLTEVTIPSSIEIQENTYTVKSIGDEAFYNCVNLEKVTISNGLTAIGSNVFAYSNKLQNVIIPKSVTKIAVNAFEESNNVVINTYTDAYAYTFAKENKIEYKLLDVKNLSKCTISSIANQGYTGKSLTPNVTMKDGNTVLKKGTDYKITYSNNKNIGKATVKITGIGKYTGTVTKNFNIIPAKISSLKAKTKTDTAITLNWSKSTGASKYEIYQYNSSKKKWQKVTTTTKTSYTVKNLKDGTTYKFKVRALKTVNKTNYYSTYSDTLSVATVPVKISKTKYTLIKGQTYTLKITGTSQTVTWSTSDKKVATVNSKGKITAVKKGTATITAKVGSKKYTCKITVETPSISKTKQTLIKGQTSTLKVSGTSQTVTWSTSDKKVATVTSKGKVTAVKKGTATITAKVGSKKYTCKITVETPSISKTKYTLTEGSSYTLKLNGNTQAVTWSTSDKKVATVTSKGKVTAVKKGTATITAKVGNKKYTCKITVNKKKETINVGDPPVGSFYYDTYGNIYYTTGEEYLRYFSASQVNKNMKKKSIGKYTNGINTREYYVFDGKENENVFNFAIYLYEIRDDGYLIITDNTYDSLGDKTKYVSVNCWQPLDKKLEINEKNVTWKISNPDVIKIRYSGDGDFCLIPLQSGTTDITLSCYDLTYTFTITVNNPKVQSNYEYKIIDVSEGSTWYAGYSERTIYIETDNPDIDSFQLVGKGISCGLEKGVLEDVIFEDRHFSNWSSTSFTDKKNYFRATDKKGYYTRIKANEEGSINLYIKEGNNTLEDTRLTLTAKSGGEEKYKEWLKSVESKCVTPSMTTYEKVKAISDWLYENCYYPTDVFKSGQVFCIEYPDAPIWEKPVFDCLAAVNILNAIIKDYDGIEDVHWDGYLFGSGGSHTAKVTIDGKEYTFYACPYRQLKEDIYLD